MLSSQFNFSFQKFLNLVSLLLVVALSIVSGWRDVGIDRLGYVEMYNGIVSNDDIAVKFFFAKDVLFLLIATASNYFNDEAKWTFLTICFISLITKYLAIRQIAIEYALGYILLYAIFLSPGLEFAAIRGAMSIGFIMLAIAYYGNPLQFSILSTLGIAAHITALPVILLAMRKFRYILHKHKLSYVLLALVTFLSTDLLLNLFPRGADYNNNRGTIYAYSEPIATWGIALLVLFRLNQVSRLKSVDPALQYLLILRPIIYALIAIAFGISSMLVTGATRFLEISWCLILFAAIVLFRKTYVNLLGGILLLVFLSYVNIRRLTWVALFNPSLG